MKKVGSFLIKKGGNAYFLNYLLILSVLCVIILYIKLKKGKVNGMWPFKKKKKSTFQSKIIISEDYSSVGSTGYTRLKDNILYMNADGKCKVIQIESSLSHEAKTTVISNLAVSLGITEKKVVVLDLDFRRPKLHRMFELEKENGIAEYMQKDVKVDDIIKRTKYKNVDIITRGSDIYNPSITFLSEKFANLIAELKEKYDYVLLDCAPVLQVSDYIHISKISDGVLFVIAYAKTTKNQVIEAINLLKKNNIKIFGTVFSMYDRKRDKEYNPYYKYYAYSEEEGD